MMNPGPQSRTLRIMVQWRATTAIGGTCNEYRALVATLRTMLRSDCVATDRAALVLLVLLVELVVVHACSPESADRQQTDSPRGGMH